MKKIALGQTITILANLGVIAGIVFLGYELQQNNELLTAQARVARHDLRSTDSTRVFFENPDMAKLVVKIEKNEPLTDDETYIAERFYEQTLLNWQFIFVEFQRGLLEPADIQVAGWRAYFYGFPSMPDFWDQQKNIHYRPDFVRWFDETIVR